MTEKEVKTCLDIKGYPSKWKKAIEYARSKNDKGNYWANARQYFLELGGGFKWQDKNNRELYVSVEDAVAFGKSCFYKGFDKCKNDDANCYTAWREEAQKLISQHGLPSHPKNNL